MRRLSTFTRWRAMPDRKADEFTCSECGREIYSLPPRDPPPTICGMCQHLLEFVPDEQEREAIRKRCT
jgi:hypothetical protein